MQAGPEAQAAASLQAGRWQEALDACAGRLGPEASDALLCAAARACLALDDAARAEALLRQSIATHGTATAAAGLLREWALADQRLAEVEPLLGGAPAGPEATLLAAIRAHLAGDFARAATLAQGVLAQQPAHPAALNHLARAVHNLGRGADALALLRRATTADPLYAEGWHNLAHALRAAGQLEDAIAAYRRALGLRPAYRSAALNLAKTWLALDRPREALDALDAWLLRGDDVDARIDRGVARQLLGRLDDAESDYAEALRAAPENGTAWMYLGALRNERGDRAGATAALERAATLLPGDPDVWAELATLHEVDNQLEAMAGALRRGLAIAPGHPRLQLEAARHERRSGRAEAAFARLRQLAPAQLPERLRGAYWYEAGRVLDRLDRADEAFSAFAQANRLAAAGLAVRGADAALMPQLVAALQRWLATADTSGWSPVVGASPVFVLGFPRSGITLLNLLFAGHPAVTALMERPTVEACADALSRRAAGYPGSLDDASATLWAGERERYAAQVRRFAADAPARPVLVDAFPLRSMHAALVARLFPGARVVFVQRHPADVVLSNFMQDYSANAANVQFLSLEGGARFYRDTMALWQAGVDRLPLQVANVRYEDLIARPEDTLRTLCTFLGIAYDAAMLAGQGTRARERRIETSSYHQVAEALHDRSIGRWRRYRRHLEPVLPLLADAGERMGYAL